MDYNKIVQGILDIGEAMLQSGAENFRLEDSFYRMCRSYGFKRSDVFVIPSNIQVTVETPEGEIITQIRHIESSEPNFDQLDYLNNLCRYVCQHTPDEKEMREKYLEVINREPQKRITRYAAGIMGGTGFAVFFGCNVWDAIVALIVSVMIVAVGDWLAKRESNLMVYNAILSFISEVIIIVALKMGVADHPDRIMIGIVMLLISGLGTTNGIRDLLQRDFISGFINIMNSFLGAAGIAFGIGLAIMLFHEGYSDHFILNIFRDGFTGLFTYHVTEIVSGKEYFISEVLDRWQPLFLRGISFEIFVEQMFEADNDVFIYSVSCVELAFVKAHTVVEQQSYVGADQSAAVFVDGMFQFDGDFLQAVHHCLPLFFGNMECFVDFVGEEGVFLYFLSERSATYKVGMKKNTMRVGLNIWQHFQVSDLSGSKTDDSSVLVVVILASIFNITTFYIFQV